MKIYEIVDRVSEVYRDEQGKVFDLRERRFKVHQALNEAHLTKGENITVAEYNKLQKELKELDKDIGLKDQYCEGISRVRELLMDMGFDTEVV